MRPRQEQPISPPGAPPTAGAAMQAEVSHPESVRAAVRARALWFGLFGGPAFWTVQLLVSYAVTAHFCYPKNLPLPAPTYGGMWTIVVVVNGLTLLGTLWAGATAIASWRTARDEMTGRHNALLEDGTGRARFMAYAGILTSGLFVFVIIISGMPLFIVPACSYGA